VQQHYSLPGRLDKHECDLAVVNGKPLVAINSLSYEIPQTKDFIKAIHAATWTVDDIKQKDPDFPIVVVMLPPKRKSVLYDDTVRVFRELRAEVIAEDELQAWSKNVATGVHAELEKHIRRLGQR
jgi:hypothetical protein